MDQQAFWAIVDAAKASSGGDQEEMMEGVRARLVKGGAEAAAGFQRRLDELMDSTYRWDLWGAAYIMNGGCSDDGFDYWRAWLIAQGSAVLEAAVRDPETLAKAKLVFGEEMAWEFEDFLYVASDAWEEVGGEEEMPREKSRRPEEPVGERWAEDGDELAKKWPKLWKKFGG